MLPDFCFSKEAIEKKRIKIQAKNFDTSKLPDKPEILIELKVNFIKNSKNSKFLEIRTCNWDTG